MSARLLTAVHAFLRRAVKNAALATWAVVLVAIVAFLVMRTRDGDHNNAANNATQFVQKFIDAGYAAEIDGFSIRHHDIAQDAKLAIPNYNAADDPGFSRLFEIAKPKMIEFYASDLNQARTMLEIESFFELVSQCVESKSCDARIVVENLATPMRVFYNAVCPYMHSLEEKSHVPFYRHTLNFLYFEARITDPGLYMCRDWMSKFAK